MKSARELVDRLRAYQPPNTDLGQHFLIDDEMLQRMVKIAHITNDDHVLEIGPGPGTLTQHLLATGARVTAIELDDTCVEYVVWIWWDCIVLLSQVRIRHRIDVSAVVPSRDVQHIVDTEWPTAFIEFSGVDFSDGVVAGWNDPSAMGRRHGHRLQWRHVCR